MHGETENGLFQDGLTRNRSGQRHRQSRIVQQQVTGLYLLRATAMQASWLIKGVK
ncbi:hypothetical protein [Larkinella ripae]